MSSSALLCHKTLTSEGCRSALKCHMGLFRSNRSMSSIGFFQAKLNQVSIILIENKPEMGRIIINFHNLFFKTYFHVLEADTQYPCFFSFTLVHEVGHISQGWAASSAVLWISVLHGLSDVIFIGSLWFSWGKGTKTEFHNSPKNAAQLSKCCQATSRLYSSSSCWCYQATSSPSSCALENHYVFINSHGGLWFPPQILIFALVEFVRKQKTKDVGQSFLQTSVILLEHAEIGNCFALLHQGWRRVKFWTLSLSSLAYGNSWCVIVCSVLQQNFSMFYM